MTAPTSLRHRNSLLFREGGAPGRHIRRRAAELDHRVFLAHPRDEHHLHECAPFLSTGGVSLTILLHYPRDRPRRAPHMVDKSFYHDVPGPQLLPNHLPRARVRGGLLRHAHRAADPLQDRLVVPIRLARRRTSSFQFMLCRRPLLTRGTVYGRSRPSWASSSR